MSTIASLGIFNGSPLRRVRRDEVAKQAFDKPDPYATCMACWVDFMRADDRDLGTAGGKLQGDGIDERDVHERQRAADLKVGESVNAMVESLSQLHRWAIYKSHGIARALGDFSRPEKSKARHLGGLCRLRPAIMNAELASARAGERTPGAPRRRTL